MKVKKITIRGELAHFKVPAKSKIQQTFDIPPISTVVGILQNLFGKDINDFNLGYIIKYDNKFKDLMTIYKEFDLSKESPTDKCRFMSDTCIVEYLYNVELIIYTNIKKDIIIEDVLVLGKANCLATLSCVEDIELLEQEGYGYNQYTHRDIGDGQIRRINTLTKFNENTDMYDIQSSLVRENIEFKYNKNYDKDLNQNVYLWHWKEGVINEIN